MPRLPKPLPRKRRPPRPWWKRRWVTDAGKVSVIVLGVGVFLRLTVNNFDSDEIKELGAVAAVAATVLRVWQGK